MLKGVRVTHYIYIQKTKNSIVSVFLHFDDHYTIRNCAYNLTYNVAPHENKETKSARQAYSLNMNLQKHEFRMAV